MTVTFWPIVVYASGGDIIEGLLMSFQIVGGLLLGLVAGSPLYEQSSGFVVTGEAARSCSEYVQSANAERAARPPDATPGVRYTALYVIFVAVTDGFLTGINYVDRERPQLGTLSDAPSRMTWLENYCKTNPSARFVEALEYLRLELIKQGT
jgi:hypothetical protein